MRNSSMLAAILVSLAVLTAASSAGAMYHPTLGRWAARDPSEYADGLNVHVCVRGNPVGKLDPQGLKSEARVDDGSHKITIIMYVNFVVSECDPELTSLSREAMRQRAWNAAQTASQNTESGMKRVLSPEKVIVPRGADFDFYDIEFVLDWQYDLVAMPLPTSETTQTRLSRVKAEYPKAGFNVVLLSSLNQPRAYAELASRPERDYAGAWGLKVDSHTGHHEALHLLSLDDKYYKSGPLVDKPKPGYDMNSMGKYGMFHLKQGQVFYVLHSFFRLYRVLGDFKVGAIGNSGRVPSADSSIEWGGNSLNFKGADGGRWYRGLEGPEQ